MADDLTKKRPQDASKININEPYEMNYWAEALGRSKEQIISCVKKVGVMVNDVKKCLGVK